MQAVLVLALEGHSGAVHFGQAVGVVYLHVEQGFDAAARLFGVGLRAHTGDAQGKGFGVLAFLNQGRAEMQGIGGQDVGHGGPEILHQLELALGVARARRNGHAAEALGAEMDAEAAREQAVAGHVLEHVVLAYARHVKAAGHEIGPAVDVGLGIANGYRGAGGAAGAVHTHEFGMRNRGEPIRILGAEIVLAGKGNPPDVLKGAQVVGGHSGFGKALGVERRAAGLLNGRFQARQLDGFQRGSVPCFGFVKVIHLRIRIGLKNG